MHDANRINKSNNDNFRYTYPDNLSNTDPITLSNACSNPNTGTQSGKWRQGIF
jgi:hypothetical protein